VPPLSFCYKPDLISTVSTVLSCSRGGVGGVNGYQEGLTDIGKGWIGKGVSDQQRLDQQTILCESVDLCDGMVWGGSIIISGDISGGISGGIERKG
jgi:hypothetical protein